MTRHESGLDVNAVLVKLFDKCIKTEVLKLLGSKAPKENVCKGAERAAALYPGLCRF